MEVINYKNSLVALTNSLLKYYGISPFHETLNEIDDLLKQNKYQNVVVLLCDGLGSKNLNDCLKKNDFLRKNKLKNITSVFPPTTTSATTSFLTGKYPSEHNWYGWDMYFKDTNETISLFLNRVKETREYPKLDIFKRDYMQYVTLIDLIKKNSIDAYLLSPFVKENTCYNLDEILEKTKLLCNDKKPKFIYGYIENPDKLMHKYGIYSKIVKEEVKNINNKIENFSKSIKNTIIFVIADHGLVKTKYINLKNDIPEIYNMLAHTTAIESRACGIKLKESILKKDFEKLFNLYLKEDFDLLTCEEVLKLKLFGKNSNQYLKDTIGDYLIVAKKNISLNYDDTSPIFKASHAGLTKDELDIPLIVIDCNKNY